MFQFYWLRLALLDAIRTITGRGRSQLRQGYFLQLSGLTDQLKQSPIAETVMDIPPMPAGEENPCLSQGHQVLRQVRLPPSESRLKVTDARVTFTDSQKNLKAGCRPDGLKEI